MHPKYLKSKCERYRKWIKTLPCLICKKQKVDAHHCFHARSNDYMCLPLCREHHREYHDHEWKVFEDKHGLYLMGEIIKHLIRYCDENLFNKE